MSNAREKVAAALTPYFAQLQRRHLDDAVDAVLAIARPAVIEEMSRATDLYDKAHTKSLLDWEISGMLELEFFSHMAAAIMTATTLRSKLMQISLDKVGLAQVAELTQAIQRLTATLAVMFPTFPPPVAPPPPPAWGDFAKETSK